MLLCRLEEMKTKAKSISQTPNDFNVIVNEYMKDINQNDDFAKYFMAIKDYTKNIKNDDFKSFYIYMLCDIEDFKYIFYVDVEMDIDNAEDYISKKYCIDITHEHFLELILLKTVNCHYECECAILTDYYIKKYNTIKYGNNRCYNMFKELNKIDFDKYIHLNINRCMMENKFADVDDKNDNGYIACIVNKHNDKKYIFSDYIGIKGHLYFLYTLSNVRETSTYKKIYDMLSQVKFDDLDIYLLETMIPIDYLNGKENHYINMMNSIDNGYNV